MESYTAEQIKPALRDCDQEIRELLSTLTSRNKNKRVTDRLATIGELLLAPVVDVELLRHICSNGLPEESGRLRVYCWMVLLGILPPEKSKWQASLLLAHRHYKEFSEEFLNRKKHPNFPYGERFSTHLPQWKDLSGDFEVWEQIEKDTMRTHSELSFFSGVYEATEVPFYKTGGRKEKEKMIRGEGDHEQWLDTLDNRLYRYDVMTRILFVVSKFNQKLKYVQGMNEILAPIFYICNLDAKEPREAETMSIFMKVASDVKELHMQEFDRTEVGLQGKLAQIEKLLMVVDYPLWARLRELEITPFFYSFRWVTLYFAQEFQLFDTITLWDHIFTHEDRYRYMDIVSVAMLECKRKFVMEHEFTAALQKLQQTCDLNVREVIERATELHRKYSHLDVEQEYTLRCQTAANVEKRIGKKKSQNKALKFLEDIFK